MKLAFILIFFTSYFCYANTAKSEPKFQFTGYKFTKKVGVQGTFDQIEWSFDEKASNMPTILKGAKIKIDSYSINSGDKLRNKNITQSLFKTWGARYIEAHVIKVSEKTKTLMAQLNIGKVSQKIEMRYVHKADVLTIKGSIDLIKMGFSESFKMLHELCKVLHTGADGVAKTWSTVDIEISGVFKDKVTSRASK